MARLTTKSLAKLLHCIAASVYILVSQAACRGLKMTLAPLFKCMLLDTNSPTTLVINSFPSLPGPFSMCPFDKTHGAIKTLFFFGSNWPIWSYPRNPKAFYPWTLIKACAPGPASLSACTLPWLPLIAPWGKLCTSSRSCE